MGATKQKTSAIDDAMGSSDLFGGFAPGGGFFGDTDAYDGSRGFEFCEHL